MNAPPGKATKPPEPDDPLLTAILQSSWATADASVGLSTGLGAGEGELTAAGVGVGEAGMFLAVGFAAEHDTISRTATSVPSQGPFDLMTP